MEGDNNQETNEEVKSRHPEENGETPEGEEQKHSEGDAANRTPTVLADGGATPANIEAGTGEVLSRRARSDQQHSEEVQQPAAPQTTQLSEAVELTPAQPDEPGSGLPAGNGKAEQTQSGTVESVQREAQGMRDSQRAIQSDPSLPGQEAGRPQRTLVPIQGTRRSGSKRRASGGAGKVAGQDSTTLENEGWESASRRTAGSRGKRGSAGYKAREGTYPPAEDAELAAQNHEETRTAPQDGFENRKHGASDPREEAKHQFHAELAASGGL